jgi:hypothetical protein
MWGKPHKYCLYLVEKLIQFCDEGVT